MSSPSVCGAQTLGRLLFYDLLIRICHSDDSWWSPILSFSREPQRTSLLTGLSFSFFFFCRDIFSQAWVTQKFLSGCFLREIKQMSVWKSSLPWAAIGLDALNVPFQFFNSMIGGGEGGREWSTKNNILNTWIFNFSRDGEREQKLELVLLTCFAHASLPYLLSTHMTENIPSWGKKAKLKDLMSQSESCLKITFFICQENPSVYIKKLRSLAHLLVCSVLIFDITLLL